MFEFFLILIVLILIIAIIAALSKSEVEQDFIEYIPVKRARRKRKQSFNLTEKYLNNFFIIDIETTGYIIGKNSIIEIAAIKVLEGKIVDEFQSLINHGRPIRKKIEKMTGITTKMLKDAPTIDKILPMLLDFIGDFPLVGHNIVFDLRFIIHDIEKYALKFKLPILVDTLYLSKKAFPKLENYKLATLIKHFNIKVEKRHRALSDAKACLDVYKKCFDILNNRFPSSNK